jgi:cell division protein FtsB
LNKEIAELKAKLDQVEKTLKAENDALKQENQALTEAINKMAKSIKLLDKRDKRSFKINYHLVGALKEVYEKRNLEDAARAKGIKL